jgi:ligand-binding sensor domain-containing protein
VFRHIVLLAGIFINLRSQNLTDLMKKPGIVACSVFLVVLICGSVGAQDYKFTHIDTRHGLSHNHITSFLKDRVGFLWMGTSSGLDRFDGRTIKAFRANPADSTSISNDVIERLFELPGGRMGIRAGGVLNVYDPAREIFQSDTMILQRLYDIGMPSGALTNVVRDGQGTFWFLHATAGLIIYPEATGKPLWIAHIEGDTTSLAAEPITALAVGARGDHWVIHNNGVLERLESRGGRWVVTYRSTYLYRHNQGVMLQYSLLVDDRGDGFTSFTWTSVW